MNINLRRLKIIAAGAVSLALPVLFLSGCANKEVIQFSPEHMATLGVRAEVTAPVNKSPEKQKLNNQDLFQVEVAIYSYLLQRHFWDDGDYSAIFLQGDDDEVAAIMKKFPNHVPPVKPSYRAELKPNRTPVDKETGKPAMILSVDTLDPEGDTVQAVGKWYAGGAVSGYYTFDLRKIGGDWEIQSVK
jgi:hypothetical protein